MTQQVHFFLVPQAACIYVRLHLAGILFAFFPSATNEVKSLALMFMILIKSLACVKKNPVMITGCLSFGGVFYNHLVLLLPFLLCGIIWTASYTHNCHTDKGLMYLSHYTPIARQTIAPVNVLITMPLGLSTLCTELMFMALQS